MTHEQFPALNSLTSLWKVLGPLLALRLYGYNSTIVTKMARKATEFSKIMLNNRNYTIQGHSRSLILANSKAHMTVPISKNHSFPQNKFCEFRTAFP